MEQILRYKNQRCAHKVVVFEPLLESLMEVLDREGALGWCCCTFDEEKRIIIFAKYLECTTVRD